MWLRWKSVSQNSFTVLARRRPRTRNARWRWFSNHDFLQVLVVRCCRRHMLKCQQVQLPCNQTFPLTTGAANQQQVHTPRKSDCSPPKPSSSSFSWFLSAVGVSGSLMPPQALSCPPTSVLQEAGFVTFHSSLIISLCLTSPLLLQLCKVCSHHTPYSISADNGNRSVVCVGRCWRYTLLEGRILVRKASPSLSITVFLFLVC